RRGALSLARRGDFRLDGQLSGRLLRRGAGYSHFPAGPRPCAAYSAARRRHRRPGAGALVAVFTIRPAALSAILLGIPGKRRLLREANTDDSSTRTDGERRLCVAAHGRAYQPDDDHRGPHLLRAADSRTD